MSDRDPNAYRGVRPPSIAPGERYGAWLVLEDTANRSGGKRMFRCECRCGRVKLVNAGNLRSGKTKSCGKCRPDIRAGQRFGRLLVVEDEQDPQAVKTLCDCERVSLQPARSLLSGRHKSCGCLRFTVWEGQERQAASGGGIVTMPHFFRRWGGHHGQASLLCTECI